MSSSLKLVSQLALLEETHWHCGTPHVGSNKCVNSVSVYMFDTGNMGKHLKAAAKDILATMSKKMSMSEVAHVTNVPQQTLQRLLANPYNTVKILSNTGLLLFCKNFLPSDKTLLKNDFGQNPTTTENFILHLSCYLTRFYHGFLFLCAMK